MLSRKLFAVGCAAVAAVAAIALIATPTRVTAQGADLNPGDCALSNTDIDLIDCNNYYNIDNNNFEPCRSGADRAYRVIRWDNTRDLYRVRHLVASGYISAKNLRRVDGAYCRAAGVLRQ